MEDQFLRSRTLIKDVFVAVAARTRFQSMNQQAKICMNSE